MATFISVNGYKLNSHLTCFTSQLRRSLSPLLMLMLIPILASTLILILMLVCAIVQCLIRVSLNVSLCPVPSAPPHHVTTLNVSSTKIEVSWGEVPVHERRGVILGYHVAYGKQEVQTAGETGHLFVGSACQSLSVILSGLEKFTTYCITVSAFTAKGRGNSSECVSMTTNEEVSLINISY